MNNLPLAAHGLDSYRYKTRFGYVIIDALNNKDALCEARRSVTDYQVCINNLQRWDGSKYVSAA